MCSVIIQIEMTRSSVVDDHVATRSSINMPRGTYQRDCITRYVFLRITFCVTYSVSQRETIDANGLPARFSLSLSFSLDRLTTTNGELVFDIDRQIGPLVLVQSSGHV
jgi:hypothetical protein